MNNKEKTYTTDWKFFKNYIIYVNERNTKVDEDKFATSFMQAKYLPERFPMKHGCYRFTAVKNGMHIESVKYDSTKEYGNLNHVVYTFDPTEL